MQYLSQRQSAPRRRTESARPPYSYRVLAIRRRGSPDVIWLTDERHYAIELAEWLGAKLTRQHLAEPRSLHEETHSVRSVRVERWTEEAEYGRWQEIWPGAGDSTLNTRTRQRKRAARRLSGLPKSGDLVECVLLAEKTRRGGWKARLVKLGLVGPITNHEEVPSDIAPNERTMLRIGAISEDGRHLQLVWQQPHGEPA